MDTELHLTEDHVNQVFRDVAEGDDAEHWGWKRLDDAAVADKAREILAQRPEGPLQVFSYGSLLWKPEFRPAASRPGRAQGWHRSFCIELTSWRGTPEAPGLMMALLPGGECTALVQEIDEDEVLPVLEALVRREMPYAELAGSYAWIGVETALGPLRALTFYAPPSGQELRVDLSLAETAALIARACGHAGSNTEYLHRTVTALAAQGIHDGNLWQLQRLVAAEIDGLG
ncbi:gamma-glutamylcyclotransferase [Salipiger mangrovisoli]|uniref:glutathione-specific gamma-glutamylcyclotransferase n=1 Tax=Salipiger mangrovisoli TaxID=2865933 RepID=A0ABR9X6I8_9RHOB|nr:gamma-glutamylcyclotransferase [Salipiger mangrovisoli]MBE9639125.1 gamma-glutamylcyclotransferase [Salipiger mangrovisoli]